jgi:peptidyl-prolyl cis-trans isomerase SurA
MKEVLFRIGIILLLLCGWVPKSESIIDRVVAVVNQEVITLSEVEKWVSPLLREISIEDRLEKQQKINEFRRKVLENLIEEKLIDQEVKKSGIKVSSKDVEAALDEIKQRNATTQEDLEKALANEGLTLEVFKKQIEKRMLRTKLIQWAVKAELKVGEKELKDFYEANIGLYRSNETYRPSHILFVVPRGATPEEVREIRMKCQKVLDKIKRGENFGEMALLYSGDPSSKDGGDLGYFKKGELLPVFEKEALRLRVGEVSGIIRTDFGFHIIKLLDRKGGGPLPFEEIKEKVKADHYEKEMEKAFRQFLTTLKEKSVIEVKL